MNMHWKSLIFKSMKANDKAITSPINNITAFLKHLKTITQIIIIILMNENELKYHASP